MAKIIISIMAIRHENIIIMYQCINNGVMSIVMKIIIMAASINNINK
jgi:hypothetical protein